MHRASVFQSLTVFHCALHRLSRLQPAGSAAVFGVVVNKHVVRHGQDVAVYAHRAGQDHLKGSGGFSVEVGQHAVTAVKRFHAQREERFSAGHGAFLGSDDVDILPVTALTHRSSAPSGLHVFAPCCLTLIHRAQSERVTFSPGPLRPNIWIKSCISAGCEKCGMIYVVTLI